MGGNREAGFSQSDRYAVILADMTVDGVVDWTTADPNDRDWQRKFQWIFRAYERKTRKFVDYLHYQFFLAGLSTDKADWYNQQKEKAVNKLTDIVNGIYPWYAKETLQPTTPADLLSVYEAAWGSLDDPEYQAKIQAAVAAINAGVS